MLIKLVLLFSFSSLLLYGNTGAQEQGLLHEFFLSPLKEIVENQPVLKRFDEFLITLHLSIYKLMAIVILLSSILFIKKMIFALLERYILKVDALRSYASEILSAQKRVIEAWVLLFMANLIANIAYDFSLSQELEILFEILYVIIVTLMIYRLINTIARVKLSSLCDSDMKMKNDLINVGIKILNSIIVVIGLLVILFIAGVDLTAVLSGLGIGGIAVAFAAKDTISNFFGTVSILISNVFSQGDWIEMNGKEGVVVEIGLRVTTLRTFDNALISIPNGTVANTDVKNWSKRTLGRRIMMKIGVKYDSKAEDIKNAVLEIRTMLDKHKGIATENTKYSHLYESGTKLVSKDDLEGVKKTLLVYLDEFASSSINILIYCFSKSVSWEEWLIVKEDVMYKIMEILEKNNLEFAFPSLSVYNEHAEIKLPNS